MPNMTTSYLPPAIQADMDKNLLATPTRRCIYTICAQRRTMKKNSGDTIRFKQWNALESATAPLGNSGITPPPNTLVAVYVDAQMQFYGDWLSINEQVVLQNLDNVLNGAAMVLGKQLRTTEDDLARETLHACANVIFCTHGGNGDNPTNVTTTDLLEATTVLQMADAETIADMEEGTNKFGTSPVYSAFFCYTHTKLVPDLTNLPGFLPKYNYPNQENVLDAEVGSFGYNRFLVSTKGAMDVGASVNGNDVYDFIMVANESYAMIDQEAYGPEFIYNDPSIAGGPMRLNGSIAWKTAMSFAILNDEWVLRLRATKSN